MAEAGGSAGDSSLLAAGMLSESPNTALLPLTKVGTFDGYVPDATADDMLLVEPYTEPAASSTTDESVWSASSVDNALTDIDLLGDGLLEVLALDLL